MLLPRPLTALVDAFPRHLLPYVYILCLIPALVSFYKDSKKQKHLTDNVPGCRKLGLKDKSNLADGHSTKSNKSDASSPCRIKALFIHPIKSCASVELDIADLSSTGFRWDRQFCFAHWAIPTHFPPDFPDQAKRKHCWVFCSLRTPGYEKLVKVRPEVWVPDKDYEALTGKRNPNPNGVLVIRYPNVPRGTLLVRLALRLGQFLRLVPAETSFRVPLSPTLDHGYQLEEVSIWKDITQALNYGQHVPQDFRSYLGLPSTRLFTLFRASPSHYRNVLRNAPRHSTRGEDGTVPYQPSIAFSDSYPIHLLNWASLQDVGAKVGATTSVPTGKPSSLPEQPGSEFKREATSESTAMQNANISKSPTLSHLTARRFRPNIVVTGPPPYDEDDWKKITITTTPSQNQKAAASSSSSATFYCACRTIRCRLPNVDPDTGFRHPSEPDNTLRSFRCVDEGDPLKAALGLQIVAADDMGEGRGEAREAEAEAEAGDKGQENVRGDEVVREVQDGDQTLGKMDFRKPQLKVGDEIEVLERGKHVYIKR